MSTEKQLEDIEIYIQNLHDRVKIIENWILKFETSHLQPLSTQEEKAIKEIVKETEEMGL